jgi:phage terminase small subunit
MGSKTNGLNDRQRRFVEAYLNDPNATQAAIKAGYSEKNADKIGPRIVGNSRVAAAIQEAQNERATQTKIDAEWVIKRLVTNVERASQVVPVLDHDGNPIGEYRYEGSVVNKALELLGRHLGMFIDRKEHTGKDGSPLFSNAVQRIVIHHDKPPEDPPAGGGEAGDAPSPLPPGPDSGHPVPSEVPGSPGGDARREDVVRSVVVVQ